jgi:ABC-type proline/glycine betaine transport system permease subunit
MEKKEDLTKEIKSWAKWGLFWACINAFLSLMIIGLVSEDNSIIQFEINAPEFLLYFTLALSIVIIVISLICLLIKVPWLGFYLFFGVYLLYIGIYNILYSEKTLYIIIAVFLFLSGIYGIFTGITHFKKKETAKN